MEMSDRLAELKSISMMMANDEAKQTQTPSLGSVRFLCVCEWAGCP